VSTWDEEAEGTGISPRAEWGDMYLQITREYAAGFNGGPTLADEEPMPEADGDP
jgi:hypothetical protein